MSYLQHQQQLQQQSGMMLPGGGASSPLDAGGDILGTSAGAASTAQLGTSVGRYKLNTG
jgi:hypothetical protein